MATKKGRPGIPSKGLRERLPSTAKGAGGEAASLVNGILAAATLDERVESLITLTGLLRKAEGSEALNVTFYATLQATLYHSEGLEMLNQARKALLDKKRK